MNRADLLAAVTAERQDYRWFRTPPKTAADINVKRDDEVTAARRRKTLLDDEALGPGRWVQRHGVQRWEAVS